MTKRHKVAALEEIAHKSQTTLSFAKRVLSRRISLSSAQHLSLSPRQRVQLAIEVARQGKSNDATRALSWQEFEIFALECLQESGFQAERNVRVKGDGRAWQIDIIGFRGNLVLAIDCKHWNTPGNLSRFKLVAEHQRTATLHLMTTQEKTIRGDSKQQALPVILTLFEPPAQFSEGAVLLSVEKLPSFLSGVAPYDENLPFITLPLSVVENPMSQSS